MTSSSMLTIGRLAEASGVAPKTVRYYEEVGLLPQPRRGKNGYRLYDPRAVNILRFVGRARELGFAMEDVKELVTLWTNKRRKSSSVRNLAKTHLEAIEAKIAKLEGIRDSLQDLVNGCRGDDRPDCPILDRLSTDS